MEHCYAKNNHSAEMISFMGGHNKKERRKQPDTLDFSHFLIQMGMIMHLTSPNLTSKNNYSLSKNRLFLTAKMQLLVEVFNSTIC